MMTTNPDATSVHADPSRANTPHRKTMVFGDWRVEVHGMDGGYWAQIRAEDLSVFATGETMEDLQSSLIEGICAYSIDLPPEADGELMHRLALAMLGGMKDADDQPE